MKEIIKTQYEVGGYLFDNKLLAQRLDGALSSIPKSIICPKCKGLGTLRIMKTKWVSDETGMGYEPYFENEKCRSCIDGITINSKDT